VKGGAGPAGQHVWGAGGQRLVGDILDNVVLEHQNQDPRQLAGMLLTSCFNRVHRLTLIVDW